MSFQLDIQSEATFKTEILQTPGTLQVIEVYQSWSGPSRAIISTFRRIYFDAGDKPLKFFTACADKIPILKEYVGKCQPVFLFFKDGAQIEKVVGNNGPLLSSIIAKN
eukprot:CAMPEP_0175072936 /NCGR_PEP_ID=MMETSP0052_2-20121109/20226_1 /TAXON_ID=51329 ORGANISM="Polytomella parva, Strain SAG 63-3" /NCGR_SAMPLE_ID=MMETSP0052_2 /ASSEMBLY_ACC=CAM_ASM_000194 /LENGTH=107 /DNA_ID=CAMNT_0016340575 /DNA_START=31 /DNA_END=354 /DNA_ORIENTATION=+